MIDRKDMRRTQNMLAVTDEQAARLKAISDKHKHEHITDTIELLLNLYDKSIQNG